MLKLQRTFGHGLRVAWYRDVVRTRVLETPPIADTTDSHCEIHVLTSEQDWLNLVWTLKSFYAASKRQYSLCIHADRSLSSQSLNTLRDHFPHARFVPRVDADARMSEVLREFPRCLNFRNTNLLAPKVLDFISYLESDRMALFDSDLLFFAEPTEFLRRIESPDYARNTFNSDFGNGYDGYTVTADVVRKYAGFELCPFINSGLGLVHCDSIRWEWIEEFLAIPGLLDGHFWRIEQTLFALCSSRFGVELLPEEYTLYLDSGIGDRPFRHYVGAIRHLMFGEGMARLAKDHFLLNFATKAAL